jgi:hypothetical protein
MRLLVLAPLLGCSSLPDYRCASDEQCRSGSVSGVCQPTEWCSVTDTSCPSAQRYVAEAGGGLGGECVPPEASDGAPSDGSADAPPWWDAGYARRARLTIANDVPGNSEIVAGIELALRTDLSALSADFGAIRLVRWTGSAWIEKPRFIDDLDFRDLLWFTADEAIAPDAADDSLWLYWDNPSPGPPLEDGSLIFQFFDGFSDTELGIVWHQSTSGITASGGLLQLPPGQSVRSGVVFPQFYAVDFSMRTPSAAAYSWAGLMRLDDFVESEPWMLWVDRDGDGTLIAESNVANAGDSDPVVSGGAVAPGTVPHLYSIERKLDGISLRWTYDDMVVAERRLPKLYGGALQIWLRNGSSLVLNFDYVRARRVLDAPPAITLGPEEARP